MGRTPGPRGSLDPLFANRISLIHNGQAGQGAGRGPGVRPTIFAGGPVMGKTSGVSLWPRCHFARRIQEAAPKRNQEVVRKADLLNGENDLHGRP